MIIPEINDAIELAAGAGDPHISSFGIGRPSTVSEDRMIRVREIIKRFCEHMPSDATMADVLESLE